MTDDTTSRISPSDQQALDAIMGEPDADQPPGERRQRVHALLGLLELMPSEPAPADLTDRTVAHIRNASATTTHNLAAADATAVDALMDAGMDAEALPEPQQQRGRRIAGLLGLMEALPAPSTGDLLVPRTMQAIEKTRQREQVAAHRDGGREPRGLMRWSDIAAVAAMLMITFSLAMPMLNRSRADAHRLACQSNLATAGKAFGTYAAAHNHALPAVKAHAGDTWWDVGHFNNDGSARSNSAHLFLMIRTGQLDEQALSCPANARAIVTFKVNPDQMRDWPNAASISFSYQNQFTDNRPKFGRGPVIAILGDKNPLFAPDEYRAALPADARSPNHAALGGQNVLLNNGDVRWITDPVLRNSRPDNIWRIEGHDRYTGTEAPDDVSDTFLVP